MPRNVFANRTSIKGDTESPEVAKPSPTKVQREQALKDATLEIIGTPDDLVKVEIRQLHDPNHFRVNIYREFRDLAKLTDSYYVTLTLDGIISNPEMKKKYYDLELASL